MSTSSQRFAASKVLKKKKKIEDDTIPFLFSYVWYVCLDKSRLC